MKVKLKVNSEVNFNPTTLFIFEGLKWEAKPAAAAHDSGELSTSLRNGFRGSAVWGFNIFQRAMGQMGVSWHVSKYKFI